VSVIGGKMPMTGFQSTIDKPDPVKRVTPPTIKITTTLTQTHLSQIAKGFVFMGSARNSSVALVGCEDMKRFVVNLLGSPNHAIENFDLRKIFLPQNGIRGTASVQGFQAQILKLGKHLGVVQLELDHTCMETFLFGQVFGKLG
jgi:hypothetical protein